MSRKVKILTAPEKYASPQLNRFHIQRGEHFTGQAGIHSQACPPGSRVIAWRSRGLDKRAIYGWALFMAIRERKEVRLIFCPE